MNDAEYESERSNYSQAIVASIAPKRLIVAGPGTGKTFVFKLALKKSGGRGLAITLINNLMRDLGAELGEVADAYTFHGYCKMLLHQKALGNLSGTPHYYPPLYELIAEDLASTRKEIEASFNKLDTSSGLLTACIDLGGYYNAVSYSDSVYRVFTHFRLDPDAIPTFPLIVVDEYQDFNLLEISFIAELAKRSNVLIAGDDDQALYDFKHASPDFIRALANDPKFERFELPYCSRCPAVVVEAVNAVIARAQGRGLLAGRLAKTFQCFVPEKRADSDRYPAIIDARCSVENSNAPYMSRYIAEQISNIRSEDIAESAELNYPTALVLGPAPFIQRTYEYLRTRFDNVTYKQRSAIEIDILDGYRILARDLESNLGWRIVARCDPRPGVAAATRRAIDEDKPIVLRLASEYVSRHVELALIVRKLRHLVEVTDDERLVLEAALEGTTEEIATRLRQGRDDEDDAGVLPAEPAEGPSIICTTLTGSKGLSAGHVFILGVNNGHFPRHPEAITDGEICSLLVGLSRTRKRCHLVSCGFFAGKPVARSVFLGWLQAQTVQTVVDKSYFSN